MFGDTAFAQSQPKSIGRFRDWESFAMTENGKKLCYAVTSPKKSEGEYTRRGEIFVMVTRRPAEQVFDEVSAIAGYTYQKGSEPEFSIGRKRYSADSVQDVAWPKVKDGKALIASMRGGSDMVLKGISSRGTVTIDTFSLLGFTKALQAIQKSCPRR